MSWELVLWAVLGFVALCVVVHSVQHSRRFRAEQANYERLQVQGRPASAEVLALTRVSKGDIDSDITLRLRIATAEGEVAAHEQLLDVRVAHELVAGFMPGRHVQVLVDPADPSIVAIDRRVTPTDIPMQSPP